MISDWHTNKVYISGRLPVDFSKTASALNEKLNSYSYEVEILPFTKDIWARDYMPIQISDDVFIEFRYDPDYLQGNSNQRRTRELKTYSDIVCDALGLKTKKTDIIIDGGNVVKSNNAIIMTDKVVYENKRNYSKKQLVEKLHDLFEIEKIVLVPWDKECEFGHSDGMMRFIDNDTVLISGVYEQADLGFKKLLLDTLRRAKIEWEWLKVADNETDENIAYINFLQTQDFIIVPSLCKPEDDIAVEQIAKYFPNYAINNRIDKLFINEIFRLGGALNCITWTTKG